jgi:hypothetical protein
MKTEQKEKRSSHPNVRNPLLSLGGTAALVDLPEEQKKHIRILLLDIRRDAQEKAEKCWRKHKAPMATYWKAVAVYAGHTARLLR